MEPRQDLGTELWCSSLYLSLQKLNIISQIMHHYSEAVRYIGLPMRRGTLLVASNLRRSFTLNRLEMQLLYVERACRELQNFVGAVELTCFVSRLRIYFGSLNSPIKLADVGVSDFDLGEYWPASYQSSRVNWETTYRNVLCLLQVDTAVPKNIKFVVIGSVQDGLQRQLVRRRSVLAVKPTAMKSSST